MKVDPKTWEKETLHSNSNWARCFSPTNIALAKYWGKRDLELNLPSNGSISVCLQDFGTFTTVEVSKNFSEDILILNGKKEIRRTGQAFKKIDRVLDEVRSIAGVKTFVRIQTFNNFPTGAGLASSASGLSALTIASTKAFGLDLPLEKLSEIARKGSGSACRSFFDGYVEWKQGEKLDGSDSHGYPLKSHEHWPLLVAIAVVDSAEKDKPSTTGMTVTEQTSPYFKSWILNAREQLDSIRTGIMQRDFLKLAELCESNCIRMHAAAMAAMPPIFYWKPKTLEVIEAVWALRKLSFNVFFTIDAGPNVVIFYKGDSATKLVEALGRCNVGVLMTKVGPGARILEFNSGANN